MTSKPASPSKVQVLLLSDESPLSLGVEATLRDATALDIIRDLSPAAVLERVRVFQPQAVVIGVADKEEGPVLEWLRLLGELPGIRLITLSLHDNCVRVYEGGQMQTLPDPTGLVDACTAPR